MESGQFDGEKTLRLSLCLHHIAANQHTEVAVTLLAGGDGELLSVLQTCTVPDMSAYDLFYV